MGLIVRLRCLEYELTYRLCMMRVLIKKSAETAQKCHHIIKPCTQSAVPARKEHFLKRALFKNLYRAANVNMARKIS